MQEISLQNNNYWQLTQGDNQYSFNCENGWLDGNTQTARHCRSYLQSNIISFKNEVVFVALTKNPLKREKYIKEAQKYLLKLPQQNSLYHSKRTLDPKRKSYKITISPQSMSNFCSCITTHQSHLPNFPSTWRTLNFQLDLYPNQH